MQADFLVKPPRAVKSAQPQESKQEKLLPDVAYLGGPNCYSEIRELDKGFFSVRESLSFSMKVSEKDVAYVAELASLELTEQERGRMVRDLNSILDYMDRLNEADTASVEPMAQVASGQNPAAAARDDVREGLRKSLPHDLAMANAPLTDGTFFKVPKVIER